MKTRWHMVGLVVLGSVIVACAQQAIEQAMEPDGGGDGALRADVPVIPAEGCCEPDPPPARTVLFDQELPASTEESPVIAIDGYRRVIIHSNCYESQDVLVRHGVVGFVKLEEVALCRSPLYSKVVTLDPQLGIELKVDYTAQVNIKRLTVVGYR